MNTKNTTETTGCRQPRPVYYEPDHDDQTNDMVAGVLALRGYRLTSDESMLADFNTPHATVIVDGDGSLTLMDGDLGTRLPHVEEFPSAGCYAAAIAEWLDGDDKYSPEEKAAAGTEWAGHAAHIGHYTRKIQEQLAELSRLSSGDPSGYRSGSPATTAAQFARDIAEEAQRLVRVLEGGES